MLVKQIVMKKGTSEKTITDFSNYLEQKGKFLASEYQNGQWVIIVHFDDEMDYLAFLTKKMKSI